MNQIKYDTTLTQSVSFQVEQNNKTYQLTHVIKPLTDERFFQLEKERAAIIKKIGKKSTLSIEIYKPLENVWNELAVERTGAKPREDWKERTHYLDKANVITALTRIEIISEGEDETTEDLFDDEANFTIYAKVFFNNNFLPVTFYFKQESKAQMDEFVAILQDKPNANALASLSNPKSIAERLCDLFDALIESYEGYSSQVPAWHKIAAVSTQLNNQMSRLGK